MKPILVWAMTLAGSTWLLEAARTGSRLDLCFAGLFVVISIVIAHDWLEPGVQRAFAQAFPPVAVACGDAPVILPGGERVPSVLDMTADEARSDEIQVLADAALLAYSDDASRRPWWLAAKHAAGQIVPVLVAHRCTGRRSRPWSEPRTLTIISDTGSGQRIVSALVTRSGRRVTLAQVISLDTAGLTRCVAAALETAGLRPDGLSREVTLKVTDGAISLDLPPTARYAGAEQLAAFRAEMDRLLIPCTVSDVGGIPQAQGDDNGSQGDGDALWGGQGHTPRRGRGLPPVTGGLR